MLKRGEVVGYDITRMVLKFTMLYGDRVIACEISGVALNDLAGKSPPNEKTSQFTRHRDEIERAACALFEGNVEARKIQIFAKHVKPAQSARL